MCAGPSPAKENEWRAESDHGTLTRAEEIKADPSRMAGVKKHHRKQTRSLSKVGRALGKR